MNTKKEKLGAGAYVLAGLSFIPLLGVLIGIICIIWGLLTKKRGGKLLALIGAVGIAFTIIFYGTLFYKGFVEEGGVYYDLRSQLATNSLKTTVQAIEYYMYQQGKYPSSMEILSQSLPEDSLQRASLIDPTHVQSSSAENNFLYYEKIDDNNYYLLARGRDGQPFTSDDITVDPSQFQKTGLVIKKVKAE